MSNAPLSISSTLLVSYYPDMLRNLQFTHELIHCHNFHECVVLVGLGWVTKARATLETQGYATHTQVTPRLYGYPAASP